MDKIRSVIKIAAFTVFFLAIGMTLGKFLAGFTVAGVAAPTEKAVTQSAVAAVPAQVVDSSESEIASEPVRVHSMISDGQFDAMTAQIRRAVNRFRGRSSIYLKHIESGKEWTHNPDARHASASLIKVPVMVGVYEKITSGELDINHEMVLTRSVRRGGSGHMKWRSNGERFTVGELLEQMITVSDNIAQQMLIDEIGLEFLQQRFPSYGFKVTNITRGGLSLAPRTNTENFTTARDMAQLLERLYEGRLFGPQASADMLGHMKRVKYRDRLPKYMPGSWEIAHKTGLVRRACHDVGIVYSPSGDYILCVLTSGAPSYRDSKRYIAKVASITYNYFGRPPTAVSTSTVDPVRSPSKKRGS